MKFIKQQRESYCSEAKELSRAEYIRLLQAAKNKSQLYRVMQTMCNTGIRVLELRFFMMEGVKKGRLKWTAKEKIEPFYCLIN